MISGLLVIATVLSGIAVYGYAMSGTNTTTMSSNVTPYYNGTYPGSLPFYGHRCPGWGAYGGYGESLNVSQVFKENVLNIAKNDTDVKNLIANGCNVTDVRPIVTTTVEADGAVTSQATSAIVTLTQSTTSGNTTSMGRAFVWVNLTQSKVTKIVTTSRTVIEKP